jgi:hypothetical protein
MWNKLGFAVCIPLAMLSKIAEELGCGKEIQNLCYDLGIVGIQFVLVFLLFLQTRHKYLWLAGLVLTGMDISNLFLNNFKINFVHGVCLYAITFLIIWYVKRRKWIP